MAYDRENISSALWEWDEDIQCLVYARNFDRSLMTFRSMTGLIPKQTVMTKGRFNLTFREITTAAEREEFRKLIRHKNILNDPNVILLSDIKDVVLFLAEQKLPRKFLEFLNTKQVDAWLRILIVYMQCYIKARKDLASVPGLIPSVTHRGWSASDMKKHHDLVQLRAIIGHFYCNMVLTKLNLGTGHSYNKDNLLFELLFSVSLHIVWLSLARRYRKIIDYELGRLFRTPSFSKTDYINTTTKDLSSHKTEMHIRNILEGTRLEVGDKNEYPRKAHIFLQNSPAFIEFKHIEDIKLLQIGTYGFEM